MFDLKLPGRHRAGAGGDSDSTKSTMEDFLFLKVLALTVVMTFFAKAQMESRFVLASREPSAETIPAAEYESLPRLELPPPEPGVFARLNGETCHSPEDLRQRIGRLGPNQRVLLQISAKQEFGDVEKVKCILRQQGIVMLIECLESNKVRP